MIKIQLCPAGELENKQWWVSDVVVLLITAIAVWFCVDQYLTGIRDDIQRLQTTASSWEKQTADLAPIVAKFTNLDKEIVELNKKIDVLSRITVSKVEKVLPIVVMDQLQTLKPSGVWFHSLEYRKDKSITMDGASRDSLLVSEFLLGLRETMNPQTWTADVRTQIGYADVKLGLLARVAADPNFKDQTSVLQFTASANVREKTGPQEDFGPTVPVARSARSNNSF